MNRLSDFVSDNNFITKIKGAFTNLKDDINFEAYNSRQKIKDLLDLHVDNNQFLNSLIEKSKDSSGIISGERGTGKTHLLLLANDNLNSTLKDNKTLSIYINLKNISFPEKVDEELFNRIFSIHIYEQLQFQILRLLRNLDSDTFLEEIKLLFRKDERAAIKALKNALFLLIDFKNVSRLGGNEFSYLSSGNFTLDTRIAEIEEICSKVNTSIKASDLTLSSELFSKRVNESSESLSKSGDYLSYLNLTSVKQNLVTLTNTLSINAITIYVDEWEKIYQNENVQKYTANFIDKINGDPIHFWIAYVPGRGNLYQLIRGADLPHLIDLDTSLIYEESIHEKSRCINYFKEFVHNRLNKFLPSYTVNYNTLFRSDDVFQELVIASMGNSRDFGIMLSHCIDAYFAYRADALIQGRPFQYINKDMIETSIKRHGETKKSNIQLNNKSNIILKDIESFCLDKKSSHFAIKITQENIELLKLPEFSELFYQRLIHVRKKEVSTKEGLSERINIYAVDFSSTYNLHKSENRFSFWLDSKPIHDKVRRYVYSLNNIIEKISLAAGESLQCKSCKKIVNVNLHQKAYEKNICPICFENLY
ncbi:P-loop NTPase fold protein [Lysinibacillus xylanilyticus]|uniref:Uncharacterized protein n=1 Tax=Lysinibacillus xylanilyticus TaxID=582475 RepID=A0A2M9Q8M6_9BACI|nr:P-loop NTPase fold protein [Lysinibacillus xylanilyticus]PJO44420.1 hypothetical protein CWD94_06795 [Lysinibacillus xylanilyticus]